MILIKSTASVAKSSVQGGKGLPKNKEIKADPIVSGVEAIKIDDTPRAKSKNLDVLKEFEKTVTKNMANFVVIGMSFLYLAH